MENSYVVALLDCCREILPEATRGGGGVAGEDEVDDDMNFIVTYGCDPNKTTPGKSTIALAYFKRLREMAKS